MSSAATPLWQQLPDSRPEPLPHVLIDPVTGSCDLPHPGWQEPLGLDLAELIELPRLRLVAMPAPSEPTGSAAPGLPDARAWSTSLSQAVIEVLSGRRPLSQLQRWTSESVVQLLGRYLQGVRMVPRADLTARCRCRCLTVQYLAERIVESAVVVDRLSRAMPLALRLEGCQRRWLCTALELPAPRLLGQLYRGQG